MTTRKITTFLMCPATDGNAMGGTPAANTASGGHIKKSAGWKHVYDLVLPALAEFGISESFTSTKDRNQQTASKDDRLGDELSSEPEVDVERDGVAHDEKAKGDDEVGGAGHGGLSSSLGFALMLVRREPLWPQDPELPDASLRQFFAPLGHCARRDFEQVGERSGGSGSFDGI